MYAISILLLSLVAYSYGLPSTQIVGGTDAPDGKYPHIVSLRQGNSHFCAGSIINIRYILTAAHCVRGSRPASIKVFAGSNLINAADIVYDVEEVIAHEKYNAFLLINDIALLRLKKDIEFTERVQPIHCDTENRFGVGHPVVLIGWGRMQVGGALPNKLQQLDLVITSNADCIKHHPGLLNSHICTYTKPGEGACHGDSGGPLAYEGTQVGIVSYGRPCAIGYPDVFTRVSAFKDWIAEHQHF